MEASLVSRLQYIGLNAGELVSQPDQLKRELLNILSHLPSLQETEGVYAICTHFANRHTHTHTHTHTYTHTHAHTHTLTIILLEHADCS